MRHFTTAAILAAGLIASSRLLAATPPALIGAENAPASGSIAEQSLTLENRAVQAVWNLAGNRLVLQSFQDRLNGTAITAGKPAFTLVLGNGAIISSGKLAPAGQPALITLAANPAATTYSERLPGKAIEVRYSLPEQKLGIVWRAILRDDSPYVRQEVTLLPEMAETVIGKLTMISLDLPGAKVAGSVRGSPIVTDTLFAAIEHPCAESDTSDTRLGWSPASFPKPKTPALLTYDLAGLIDKPGTYNVDFQYRSGNHRIDVNRVRILAGGKPVAEDAHPGFAGHPNSRNRYELKFDKADPAATYTLEVEAFSDGNSNGAILISRDGQPLVMKTTGKVECSYSRMVPLPAGQPFTISAVIGGAEKGQLRRAFNHYLERERALPYRQFLHYNSWYHLNIDRPNNRMTEAEAIKAVEDIGTELTAKRGLVLKSYVMDDGWDSHEKVWDFNENFPQGFTNVSKAAAKYSAGIGLWMSPFGGYGGPHDARVKHGRAVGFETNANGLSMAGKNYQTHFLNTCLRMINDYHANFFKFDGMGGGNFADGADSAYANDMDAMFNVILKGIRKAQPDTYISATVGTWPSPFWTRYADSIWRQGGDTDLAGVGNGREKWITYRDGTAYGRICQRGPLYPFNALMLHGLVIGNRHNPSRMDRDEASVRHEARTFFGCGTSLQELYISPELLTPAMWDAIAESAKWSRKNVDVLADTHWVGGNPGKLEVYGWAAWTPAKATLCLRNPSDKPQTFTLNADAVLELPANVPRQFTVASAYADTPAPFATLDAAKPIAIELKPFEVVVLELTPAK